MSVGDEGLGQIIKPEGGQHKVSTEVRVGD